MKPLVHACLLFCLGAGTAAAEETGRRYLGYRLADGAVEIATSDGRYLIKIYTPEIVETSFIARGSDAAAPSHAIVLAPRRELPALADEVATLRLDTGGIAVAVDKAPLRISYSYKGRPLVVDRAGTGQAPGAPGFVFALGEDEALYGGGERAVGMNRRGQRLRLYNQASYGAGKFADAMGYGIPMVLSTRRYALHFDNPETGWLDLDSRKDGSLRFEPAGGRQTYQVIAGDGWAGVADGVTRLTGRQPLPPRWAFGNFASRFGYRDEAEVRAVVDRFAKDGIPLDAVVLDLYWFGKTIKGTMGNLAWDRDSFPHPEQMMADLGRKGVKTILITEPFVLTTSKRWDDAVRHGAIARDAAGKPFTFDFYFGNTGLVDVFDPAARAWFWNIYKELKAGGVAGWWGDLGEPEKHPAAIRHAAGTADQVHNIYGHEWARMLHDGYARDFPAERPFILMRAGYSGSQGFGMIPWSGDVGRGWGGLQAQAEIALQMGMQGQAYMHSDLGGFAGPVLDDELYVRWLQYGVFQPIFRPHAQQQVAPEPVFRTAPAKARARAAVRLRYAMLPYNYTAAFANSRTGMPLMRPVLFDDPDSEMLPVATTSSSYLWGPDFLVAPVVERGAAKQDVLFPGSSGTWFDFYTDERHRGGIIEAVPTVPEHIPTYVRAGAFVPLAHPMQTTRDYDAGRLELHYWHDAGVPRSSGELYDDDGHSAGAFEAGNYELVRFSGRYAGGRLALTLKPEPGAAWASHTRVFELKLHGLSARPRALKAAGRQLPYRWDGKRRLLEATLPGVLRDALNVELRL